MTRGMDFRGNTSSAVTKLLSSEGGLTLFLMFPQVAILMVSQL